MTFLKVWDSSLTLLSCYDLCRDLGWSLVNTVLYSRSYNRTFSYDYCYGNYIGLILLFVVFHSHLYNVLSLMFPMFFIVPTHNLVLIYVAVTFTMCTVYFCDLTPSFHNHLCRSCFTDAFSSSKKKIMPGYFKAFEPCAGYMDMCSYSYTSCVEGALVFLLGSFAPGSVSN